MQSAHLFDELSFVFSLRCHFFYMPYSIFSSACGKFFMQIVLPRMHVAVRLSRIFTYQGLFGPTSCGEHLVDLSMALAAIVLMTLTFRNLQPLNMVHVGSLESFPGPLPQCYAMGQSFLCRNGLSSALGLIRSWAD